MQLSLLGDICTNWRENYVIYAITKHSVMTKHKMMP